MEDAILENWRTQVVPDLYVDEVEQQPAPAPKQPAPDYNSPEYKKFSDQRAAEIKAALEDLKAPVEGVVTTYNKPFTAKDHEAITANIPVFGEVKGQRVVYAYADDQKKASEVRVKDPNAKGALAVKK